LDLSMMALDRPECSIQKGRVIKATSNLVIAAVAGMSERYANNPLGGNFLSRLPDSHWICSIALPGRIGALNESRPLGSARLCCSSVNLRRLAIFFILAIHGRSAIW
jgi:hypothetical protein